MAPRVWILKTILLPLAITACARGDLPEPQITNTPDREPQATQTPIVVDNSIQHLVDQEYAVIWVQAGENLALRTPAGISGTVVENFDWKMRGIELTGNTTLLGSSLWLEVISGEEAGGWVNSWNLTEAVSNSDFCSDSRVIDLLTTFRRRIEAKEYHNLTSLISPSRGLIIRLNWYSPDIIVSQEMVADLFSNVDEIEWGTMADSGLSVVGSFPEVINPKLIDVILQLPEYTCNHLQSGNTANELIWPDEFVNLNYYGAYRPATNGNEFDWRSWAIGIEYIQGDPYIAVMIHYSSEL